MRASFLYLCSLVNGNVSAALGHRVTPAFSVVDSFSVEASDLRGDSEVSSLIFPGQVMPKSCRQMPLRAACRSPSLRSVTCARDVCKVAMLMKADGHECCKVVKTAKGTGMLNQLAKQAQERKGADASDSEDDADAVEPVRRKPVLRPLPAPLAVGDYGWPLLPALVPALTETTAEFSIFGVRADTGTAGEKMWHRLLGPSATQWELADLIWGRSGRSFTKNPGVHEMGPTTLVARCMLKNDRPKGSRYEVFTEDKLVMWMRITKDKAKNEIKIMPPRENDKRNALYTLLWEGAVPEKGDFEHKATWTSERPVEQFSIMQNFGSERESRRVYLCVTYSPSMSVYCSPDNAAGLHALHSAFRKYDTGFVMRLNYPVSLLYVAPGHDAGLGLSLLSVMTGSSTKAEPFFNEKRMRDIEVVKK